MTFVANMKMNNCTLRWTCSESAFLRRRIYNSYSCTCRRLTQNRSLVYSFLCGLRQRRIDGTKREQREKASFPEILAQYRSRDRQVGMGLALNAITYQSLETWRGRAVRCILINNGEAVWAATFVRRFHTMVVR